MAEKKSVEEQVAELTEEQKDKIVKIGKLATPLIAIAIIPILFLVIGFFVIINPPAGLDIDYDKFEIGVYVLTAICVIYCVGIIAFIKTKYPFYSDAKCKYLNKLRKGK